MSLDLTCPSGHRFSLPLAPDSGAAPCPQCGQTVALATQTIETCAWTPVAPKPGDKAALPERGQRLGRFVLLEKVGEGGAGIVWRAYDPSLDRNVALKLPRAGLIDDADDVATFLREGLAAGKLRHPHIVPVHDAGQASGYCYIASAFIEGQTLKQAIERRGRFAPREAAQLVAWLAAALHHAHGLGVIHRDIKPGNIMLDDQGEPQIMDFGLAHRGAAETLRTADGAIVGTPAYMSPEQTSAKSGGIDARSDLWGLGVVLYELLTGKRPFSGTVVGLMAEIQTREPIAPRKLAPAVPRDLETICLKCLSKSPQQRYTSCRALADDLGRFLRGEPIHARPVSRVERTVRWCRRQPALASAIAIAMAFLVGATALGGYHLAFRSEASEQTKRLTADLGTKEQQVQTAQSKATQEQQRADNEYRSKQRQICENKLARALDLCDGGDIDHGLLLLVDALQYADNAGAPELDRVLRLNIAAWLPHISRLEQVFQVPESALMSSAVSADGKKLVVSGARNHVWDLERGSLQSSNANSGGFAMAVAWNPDAASFATLGAMQISAWDAATGELRWVQSNEPASVGNFGGAFSHDGSLVAACGSDGQVRVLNATTGERLATLAPGEYVVSADFSPDGKLLAVGGRVPAVSVWDVETWQPIQREFTDATIGIRVLFAADSAKLMIFGNGVQLFDPRTGLKIGARVMPLSVGTMPLLNDYSVALSPDGRMAAIRTLDSRAHLFDLGAGQERGAPLQHQAQLYRQVFSPNGRHLLTSSMDGTARVWDCVTTASVGQPLRHGPDAVQIAGFSPDGSFCYSGTRGGDVRLWRNSRAALSADLRLAGRSAHYQVHSTLFSAAGQLVTLGRYRDSHYSARTWDLTTGQVSGELPIPPESQSTTVAVTRDGTTLAVGYRLTASLDTYRVQLWNIATQAKIGEPVALAGYDFPQLEFAAGGRRLVVADNFTFRPMARAHFVDRLADAPTLSGQMWNVIPLRYAPDGETVLCRRKDSTLGLFTWPLGHEPQPIGEPLATPAQPSEFQFSGDGSVLFVLCVDGVIQAFDTRTGHRLGPAIQSPGEGVLLAVNHSGSLVAVAGRHEGIRVWDSVTGHAVGPALVASPVEEGPLQKDPLPADIRPVPSAVMFSTDGRQLVAAHSDRIRRWQIPQSIAGSFESLRDELEVITGIELSEDGSLVVLSAEVWRARRESLAQQSGTIRDLFPKVALAAAAAGPKPGREQVAALSSRSDDRALVETERWQRGELDHNRQLFGERDQRTLDAMNALADTLSARGKLHRTNAAHATAIQLFEASRSLYLQAGNTRNAAGKLYDLGNVALDQRDYPAARRLFTDSRAGFAAAGDQRNVGSTGRKLTIILNELATERLQQRDYIQAEQFCRECLQICEPAEPDAWTTFRTKSQLGASLLGQQNYSAAEPFLLAGYEGLKQRADKIPQPDLPVLTAALQRLVDLYTAWDKKDEAHQWQLELDRRATPSANK